MTAQRLAEEAEQRPAGTRPRKPRASLRWRIFGIAGETVLILGLVMLGFLGYEMWGTVGELNAAQGQLDQERKALWDSDPTVRGAPRAVAEPPADGTPASVLAIPRLGLEWTVVEGTRSKDLRHAPGHYAGTAPPGQIGNFAVAGHRVRGMFWDLDTIKPGDQITVEDRTRRYVYEVDANRIVRPDDVGVLLPVPGKPGQTPTEARLTLTTCNPKWDNYERLIIDAHLVGSAAKADSEGAR
ncbi:MULTISPECIES: class E sortase [Amycolatopsis]|uniref:Class E sortase n=1 Tax=Amycolatopsis echigonensis TaxID=2576905 RepID=A0A2N3WNH1_9PSEU|nr:MULTISPECIES: class E sortase [Amycolatopsis]MBB2498375.1 class E sortase [Amycolatopsis echigonensis]PKV95419.1 sortase A [Amycolatopsis niigatensis]